MGRIEASTEERYSHGASIVSLRLCWKRRMEYTAYIGLGSNLPSFAGGPAETVEAAMRAMEKLGAVSERSSLYRTAPVGFREQPEFINAVARLETDLDPERLLQELLAIERGFGRDRRRSVPKGPRTLDLDLLLVFRGDNPVLCKSPTLKLPHPEIPRRRFVLEPLAEIAPEVRHPPLGKTMRQLLEELSSRDEVKRLAMEP
jgi:2-amino-4-hydroxy-6-hydroxymethyldihydropteridine diphosphokinase